MGTGELPELERRLTDSVERLAARIDRMQDSLTDVRERLIRMEASSVQHVVDSLQKELVNVRDEVAVLKSTDMAVEAGRKTLATTADWFYKLAPWLFATGLVVFTQLNH